MGKKRKVDKRLWGGLKYAGKKGSALHGNKWFRIRKLTPRDWSQVELEEVKKDFYKEHPKVKERYEDMIEEYMDQNRISVEGHDCPKPCEVFDEFCFPDDVMAAVEALNFEKPTPIQSQAIPVALSGRDLVGIADTGSGKTLAFILPAITHILGNTHLRKVGEPEVVVLVPTRELAQQIHQVVLSLEPSTNVKSACFFGGSRRVEQTTLTRKVFEICIATPGRMVDFLQQRLVKLHRCTIFVLDEADRMLDLGLQPQLEDIIYQARPDRQILMFSATWPTEIQGLADKYLKDYIRVNIGSLQISANHNITQKLEFCEDDEKPRRIVKVMKQVMEEKENKTLIFVNSKVEVDILTLKFRVYGWEAMGLHGSKKQSERDRVFGDFKSGKIPILIATDLAARGLDVDDIKYIVNYDYPVCSENYVHRIGRTGRCDRKGTAVTFLNDNNRDKAKDLILVLEEAGQFVPNKLRSMAKLPPLVKKGKGKAKKAPPGGGLKRGHIKRMLIRGNVNSIPLGPETNANSLPNLEDILDPSWSDEANPNEKQRKKERNKLFNSEKVWMGMGQPKSSKIAKTDLDSDVSNANSSNRFTDNYYSENLDNPHWAPSAAASQKYGENSRTTPVTGSVNVQNPNLDMRDMHVVHKFEMPFNSAPISDGVRRGNNVCSADDRYATMPVNSRNYETSMGPRTMEPFMNDVGMRMPVGPVNTRMPANAGSAGMDMNLRGMHPSFSARHETRESCTERSRHEMRGSCTESSRHEMRGPYTESSRHEMRGSYPENSRHEMTGSYPENSRHEMRGSYPENSRHEMRGSYPESSRHEMRGSCTESSRHEIRGPYTENSRHEVRGSSTESSRHEMRGPYTENSRHEVRGSSTESSRQMRGSSIESSRHEMRGSFNQNNVEWNRAPPERSRTYNDYADHQTSNWRPYNRNNYSADRMNMNCYPGQNLSGRSGYSQY